MNKEILGYKCLECGKESDKEKDFIISEEDVLSVCCSSSVYPMDILKGVKLQ